MLGNLNTVLAPVAGRACAVGAFNVTESTMFKAVVEAAEELRAPVIVQVSPNEVEFCDVELYRYFTDRLWHSPIPCALHYDHGKTFEGCMGAIRAGFTSVMFDGSRLPFEENIALTREIVRAAHAAGVTVEGKVGSIGEMVDFETGAVDAMVYSDADQAARFVAETGVDALAVSIGTVHGLVPVGYKPKIRLDVLEGIAARVPVPLVMHGGSGMPDDQVAQACRQGISKVNVSSEFKRAYYERVAQVVASDPSAASPTKIAAQAVEEVKEIVKHKIELFGSAGVVACC